MKKVLSIAGILFLLAFTGCEQPADVARINVSEQADNFQVHRTLTVINLRSDEVIYEISGFFSLQEWRDRIVVVLNSAEGVYENHYIATGEWIAWFIQDNSGAEVSRFQHEVLVRPPRNLIPRFDWATDDRPNFE